MRKRSKESFRVRKSSVSPTEKKSRYNVSRDEEPPLRRPTPQERVKNARIEAGSGDKLWLQICKVVAVSEPREERALHIHQGADVLTQRQLEIWDETRDVHTLSGISLQDLKDVGAVPRSGDVQREEFARAVFRMPIASKRKSKRSKRKSRKKRTRHTHKRKSKFDRA